MRFFSNPRKFHHKRSPYNHKTTTPLNLTMSNISPFTGNMAPPAAPPRQFVINFIRRAPRERYSNLLFENYQRLVDSMTPSELGLAVSSMSSNELYAVSQENQDEFQNPDFLLQLITAGAVPEDKLDAYKDRRAYQRIKDVCTRDWPSSLSTFPCLEILEMRQKRHFETSDYYFANESF